MLNSSLYGPDERGKRWLQAKVGQVLAGSAVQLATPRSEREPSCYWGKDLETETTLYLLLEDDPEPKCLRFSRALLDACGAGQYARHQQATSFINRRLRQLGILSL